MTRRKIRVELTVDQAFILEDLHKVPFLEGYTVIRPPWASYTRQEREIARCAIKLACLERGPDPFPKIFSIKYFRDMTGWGLLDSKHIIDTAKENTSWT